jgi:hypothetical protein
MVEKVKMGTYVGIVIFMFGVFTYLLDANAKQDEASEKKADISQLLVFEEKNEAAHAKLTDNQQVIYDKLSETQNAVGRIEGYMKRMSEENEAAHN